MRDFRLALGGVPQFVAMCGFLLVSAVGWGQTWREVQSPHFRVVTDGSEQDGRAVAKEFEQMRHVFEVRFKTMSLEQGAPLLVVAVRDPGLHALGPGFWKDRERFAGEFFSGWERQFAMIRLDAFGDLNQAVVFHEYAHSVLHAKSHWLPMWLDEGMAEFYAYTRFQGDRIYVGAPSIRLQHVRTDSLMPMAEVLKANRNTFAKDNRRQDLFYAESWAAVHYAIFGKEMEGGAKLNQFMTLLDSGLKQDTAFQQAFGDMKAFEQGLSNHIRGFTMSAMMLPPLQGLDAKTFSARVLKPAEVEYELGSFEVGAHDRATGRTRLEAAVKADPELAGAHEELGFLQWDEGRDQEAKEEWRKAVAVDPGRYRAAFALLMNGTPVSKQAPDQLKETTAALERLTMQAPKFAPPFVVLALVDWRLRQMQEAYKSARTAEQLEPWRAGYHLLTAYVLLHGNQPATAGTYARFVAERWPGSDHDEAVDLWNQLPVTARGDGAALTMNLPNEATVARGTIVSTSCDRKNDRFQLTVVLQPVGEGVAQLKVVSEGGFESGFSDTLWVGRDHFTTCHHLEGLPAVVAYKASGAEGGKLVALEVRDDLPVGDGTAKAANTASASSTNIR